MNSKKKSSKSLRGMYLRGNMWYCRIADHEGKILRKSLASDKQTAMLMLNELRRQVELQRAGLLQPIAKEAVIKTFEELRSRYIDHYKTRAVAVATIYAFKLAYKRIILENHFVYLQDISLPKVEAWARRAAQDGLTGQSINMYVKAIRHALRWAQENGFIGRNPLANWVSVRTSEPRPRRDFQPDEVARLFEVETDPEWRLLWLVYFNTGLRLSAGRSMRWEWIDWSAKLIRLPVEHNKSHRLHEIPMSTTLFDALMRHRDELGEKARGEIFSYVCHGGIRARLVKLCKNAGIDTRGICVHSIRHTVATKFFENTGNNVKAVQMLLGHSDPATTMRYLHVTGEETRQAINELGFG